MKSLAASAQGSDAFSLSLPGAPYSVSGGIIRLHWALELVAEPRGQLVLLEFTLALGKQALVLPVIDSDKPPWWKNLQDK
jgi:hypothetical protein